MVKRIFCAVCVLLICLSAAGCSGSSDSSAADSSSGTEAVSKAEADSSLSDSSAAGTHHSQETAVGERLKAVYDLYDKGSYTLECVLTGSEIDGEIKIQRVVKGKDIYQLQTERLGSHGTVTFDGKTYDFDYVCGMYREADHKPILNVVQQIVSQNVPQTNNLAGAADDSCDIEQYTYTGDTYITVMDFYFDKQDGHLVKYDTTYSVEGQDDVTESRVITRLDNEVDESVFNAYFADQFVDFDSMNEMQRTGFCQGLCGSWGITGEEMFEFGVSSSSLGTIDYDTLFRLIHTYGKPHQAPEPDESSEAENSAAEDESSEAESSAAEDESSEAESSAAEDESSEAENSAAEDESSSEEDPADAETPADSDDTSMTEEAGDTEQNET